MFGSKKVVDEELEAQRDELLDEMVGLRGEIKELRAERGDLKTRDALQAEIERLSKRLVEKQIAFDREEEKWAKEKRETEHQVGLHLKQSEADAKIAVRDAELKVREEALTAKEQSFKKQLADQAKSAQETKDFLEGAFDKVFERLPDVNVALSGKLAK